MNEVAFVHSNLAPVEESPSLATMQPLAGVTCPNCGNLFTLNHANRKYCTEKCRKRSEYERLVGIVNYAQRNCIICGNDFKPKKKTQVCCSIKCSQKRQVLASLRAWRLHQIQSKELNKPRNCSFCGNVYRSKYNQSQAIYCSKKCKQDAHTIRRLPPRIERICILCKSVFNTGIAHQKTCSKKCQQKHSRNIAKLRNTESSFQIKLANGLRSRVLSALQAQGCKRANNTMKLLGCSCSELKLHLESLWLPGMTWENRGYYGWHIDHIAPCASFDLSNPEQQKKCFHYTNLQPLWWIDNLKKNSRTDCSVRLV